MLEEVYDLARKDLLSSHQTKSTEETKREDTPDPNLGPFHATESIMTDVHNGSSWGDISSASTLIGPSSPVETKHKPSPPPSGSPTPHSPSDARRFTSTPQPPVKIDYICLHPPFTSEISYEVLSHNPGWFLDPSDFIPNGGVPYPDILVPPPKGDEARCTFCRKKWEGAGSGVCWREHVAAVHGIEVGSKSKPEITPKDKDKPNERLVERNPKAAEDGKYQPKKYCYIACAD